MSTLKDILSDGAKKLAILIDPDKEVFNKQGAALFSKLNLLNPDFLFVGGSTVDAEDLEKCLQTIKTNTDLPTILFPGGHNQLNEKADGILFLSLLSGRNPDYLIGHQVQAAKHLKKMNIEVIPTAYLLIDGGKASSVSYVSQTTPIPSDQINIAVNTAVAGQLLGFSCVFMDAGSGALNSIPTEMIAAVKNEIDLPLIIGGGIRSLAQIEEIYNAGADVVVIGNKIEEDVEFLLDLHLYLNKKLA
jgi:putative glycerol-1-phosphate prenyltransferase